jgi:hypothetical protein
VRLASLVGNTLWRLVTPNIAYAFDLGVGGLLLSGDHFSYFAAGRPAQMNKIAGDNQSAPAGAALPTAPAVQIVTTHHGSTPVGGATVTCTPSAASGTVAGTGVAVEGPSGTYTCPSWTLGTTGTNTLVVTASNLDPAAAGGSATFTATGVVGCASPGCPNPILALKSIQSVIIGGSPATQYNLTVTNRSSYPDQMFAATAGVVCGANTSASRTWADIYNANGDAFLNGFCTLGVAANLDNIYFIVPNGGTPPSDVYLRLTDHVLNSVYTSNTLNLGVPNPVLVYTTSEQYSTSDGLLWDRYSFNVSNYASFSSTLFAPLPGATSCVSKTWVEMFNAGANTPMEIFCGFSSPSDMNGSWIAVPRWTDPPALVNMKLLDQATNTFVATSNSVALYGPVFNNFPRSLDLRWAPVPNAATYTVIVEYCETWASPDWRQCNNSWITWATNTVTAPTTNFTSGFVGAQPGRWRVMTIDAAGNLINTSAYRYFKYII